MRPCVVVQEPEDVQNRFAEGLYPATVAWFAEYIQINSQSCVQTK